MRVSILREDYVTLKRFLLYAERVYLDLKRSNDPLAPKIESYTSEELEMMTNYKYAFQKPDDNISSYTRILLITTFLSSVSVSLDPFILEEKILAEQLSNMSAHTVTSFINSLIVWIKLTPMQEGTFDVLNIGDYCLDDYFYVKGFEKETKILNQLVQIVNDLDDLNVRVYDDVKDELKRVTTFFRTIISAENKREEKDDTAAQKEVNDDSDSNAVMHLCDEIRRWLVDVNANIIKWSTHFEELHACYHAIVDHVENLNGTLIWSDDAAIITGLNQTLDLLMVLINERLNTLDQLTADEINGERVLIYNIEKSWSPLQTNMSGFIDSVREFLESPERPSTIKDLCGLCETCGVLLANISERIKEKR